MKSMNRSFLDEIEKRRQESLIEMEKHKKLIKEEMHQNKLILQEIDQEIEKKHTTL